MKSVGEMLEASADCCYDFITSGCTRGSGGKLKSGRSGKKVKSRKQAVAIRLSQARKAGGKVPKKHRKISRLFSFCLE